MREEAIIIFEAQPRSINKGRPTRRPFSYLLEFKFNFDYTIHMQNPRDLIIEKLKEWQEKNSLSGDFEVSVSQNLQFGDFATNICLQAAKNAGKNPRELAENLKSEIENWKLDILDKIEVAGPGFINFFLNQEYLAKMLQEITQSDNLFVYSNKRNTQKVIVEYSSPNIAKPFTVGHLRSTIIGDAVANLLEAVGYEVKRDNHLGDWGSQFGKQICAIKHWGNIEEIEKSQNPVKDLVALYVKFHEEVESNPELEDEAREWFKKLEEGDPEARALWQKCINWSLKEFERIYSLLGVTFTENSGLGYGESFFEDKMGGVIDELREKGFLKQDEGAELVYFPEEKYPPLMILKKDGTTLYATRDLATDKFRLDTHGSDVMIINEVGIEQELYFRQLFEVEKMLGWVKEGQRAHIKHGHYRFAEGKMSTRKGNVIWLEEVLGEAEKRASELSKETVDRGDVQKIAIGALKWNDLRRESKQDITFDWNDILNMQGNSGPYLQYTYVRTQSVLGKVKYESRIMNYELGNLKTEEKDLLRFLTQFPYHVEISASEFAPNLLCNYLFELSQKFNLFYQKHKIIGGDNEEFRLQLTSAVGNVLKNLLGISTVEKM